MSLAVNYLSVLAAAVASMVLGFLWYGPLFGKQWMHLSGISHEQMQAMQAKGMGTTYAVAFVGALVTAYVLAQFSAAWGASGITGAWQLAFWLWLGFIATTLLCTVLWERKPVQLYLLNVAYHLVNLFLMALILMLWK